MQVRDDTLRQLSYLLASTPKEARSGLVPLSEELVRAFAYVLKQRANREEKVSELAARYALRGLFYTKQACEDDPVDLSDFFRTMQDEMVIQTVYTLVRDCAELLQGRTKPRHQ